MIDLYVCVGSACHIRGSYNVIARLQELIEHHRVEGHVTVKAALCLGSCSDKVSVRINEGLVTGLAVSDTDRFFTESVLPLLKA